MIRSQRTAVRRFSLVLAVSGAAITVMSAAQPGAASPVAGEHITLLASSPVTSALIIPCPTCVLQSQPAGAHIGGTEIDTGTLTEHGKTVGHFALQSIGVTPFGANGPGELQLSATLVINGEQLIAVGLEEPPLGGGTAAITGGTGRFRNARGQIRYTDNADNSTNLSIDLNP